MITISEEDIKRRISRDNPWWNDPSSQIPEAGYPKRVYFDPFAELALSWQVKRATVLLGPRRVGKTVMIKQIIAKAIADGFDPKRILYASIDAPVYAGIPLERYLDLIPTGGRQRKALIIFDEIQYLRDWEVHLKDLVDSAPQCKFIATGSAAAALRLKSKESGAGRFSDFMLPPLTFYEFLLFTGDDERLINSAGTNAYVTNDIDALNTRFIDYLNFGGYPEVVLNPAIRQNPEQFIRNDIIDKVLLKDLPSLYGISEIQELNKLFSFLAYNAGSEANLENISQGSGLAKPTIKRYIEYLESAFLIIKLPTVNENCRTLKRERNFKVYLSNPSMRAALFAPVAESDMTLIGHLTESAIFSQWQHSPAFRQLRYARWKIGQDQGEVDCVLLEGSDDRPGWIGEIKWSDRIRNNESRELKHIKTMHRNHEDHVRSAFFTTKTLKCTPFRPDIGHSC